jgi:hypothetical protein
VPGFEERYPRISHWVRTHGWIELGHDGMSRSWIRAVDAGGLIWEGGDPDKPLDDAFQELEAALAEAPPGLF